MLPDGMRVLTVTSFGETAQEDLRVTLSPMNIKMTAAKDGEVQGRPIKMVAVLFMDGESVELNLNEYDLLQVENVIGAYGFFEA